jgi:hypothetical protein
MSFKDNYVQTILMYYYFGNYLKFHEFTILYQIQSIHFVINQIIYQYAIS